MLVSELMLQVEDLTMIQVIAHTIRSGASSNGNIYNDGTFILTRGNDFFIDGGTGTSIKIRTRFAIMVMLANPDDGGGSGTVEFIIHLVVQNTRRLETSGIGITVTGSNIKFRRSSAANNH